MQKKILLSYIIIILLAIGISATTFWNTGYEYIDKDNNQQYIKQAELIADAFTLTKFENEGDFSIFANEYGNNYDMRISVIELDGNVISDRSIIFVAL